MCKRVGFMYSYGAMCQCTVVSVMLLLRCWALYGGRRVLWFLFGGLIGAVVSGVIVVKFLLDRALFLNNPFPSIFSGCIVALPDYVWILYITPLIYELSLFVFTIWRIHILTKDCGTTPLMQTLAHNGITYFATLLVLMILACIGGTIQAVKIAANASGILTAMSSAVSSHMILSLHGISHEQKPHDPMKLESATCGDTDEGIMPQFAVPMETFISTGISHNQC
ncbi:unnamed protein product [Rhizoctonia solani]|uniref:Uncharacterized protein n=1 Tax=Rhizoctonia solani TaxID=456999 RepID=A0A8H2WF15_9AGAM|nr:unnamed protein product [Rhizoctonia solani]